MKRLVFLMCVGLTAFLWDFSLIAADSPNTQRSPSSSPLSDRANDPSENEVALQTQKNEIPIQNSKPNPKDSLFAPESSAPSSKETPVPENVPVGPLLNSYQLKQITFEPFPQQIHIKITASGGFSKLRQEKLVNPGRLVLEIPNIMNATNLSITALTDHLIIPRIRLAQHPDRLRIIVDTVLMNFPNATLHKTDQVITLKLEKTPEMMAEAKSKSDLFLAMQRNDREALLKMGSDDEGGILFNDQFRSRLAGKGKTYGPGGGGVKVEAGAGGGNRIVFMLDDRKEYKIFIEDTETPIHIRKIRPVFEVKGIQARLKQLGYDVGTEDGSMGPKTREALRQYQKDKGIAVTGSPNKKTQHALKNEFGY